MPEKRTEEKKIEDAFSKSGFKIILLRVGGELFFSSFFLKKREKRTC